MNLPATIIKDLLGDVKRESFQIDLAERLTYIRQFADLVDKLKALPDVTPYDGGEFHKIDIDDLPLEHFFIAGVYVRLIWMPAGLRVTSRIHKHENISILLAGEIEMYMDGKIYHLTAPWVSVCHAGMQRHLNISQDMPSLFATVHKIPDYITTAEEAKTFITCENEAEYLDFLRSEK